MLGFGDLGVYGSRFPRGRGFPWFQTLGFFEGVTRVVEVVARGETQKLYEQVSQKPKKMPASPIAHFDARKAQQALILAWPQAQVRKRIMLILFFF